MRRRGRLLATACAGLCLAWVAGGLAHPNHDEDDGFKEDVAEMLRVQQKPCARVVNIAESLTKLVITCEVRRGSRDTAEYTIPK